MKDTILLPSHITCIYIMAKFILALHDFLLINFFPWPLGTALQNFRGVPRNGLHMFLLYGHSWVLNGWDTIIV